METTTTIYLYPISRNVIASGEHNNHVERMQPDQHGNPNDEAHNPNNRLHNPNHGAHNPNDGLHNRLDDGTSIDNGIHWTSHNDAKPNSRNQHSR